MFKKIAPILIGVFCKKNLTKDFFVLLLVCRTGESLMIKYETDYTIKRKKIVLRGGKNFKLPENLQVEYLDLSDTDGAEISPGSKCKFVNLTNAKNFKLPKDFHVETLWLTGVKNAKLPENLQVSVLDMSYTENVRMPSVLCCDKLSLYAAKKIKWSERLYVNELDLAYTNRVVVPMGVTCKSLRWTEAVALKCPFSVTKNSFMQGIPCSCGFYYDNPKKYVKLSELRDEEFIMVFGKNLGR